MTRFSKAILLSTASCVLGAVSPALSQEVSFEEEILVTARKKQESLKDVPISISAFTADALQDKLIINVPSLSDFTPGFQQQQAFGRDGDRPVIRGASNILEAEGKVGFFIDGVPLTGDLSGLDFSAFQQVEVIKGPQSALFGRGTLTGAINFVTRRPTEEWTGQIQGTYGNFDTVRINGNISGPIIDGISAVISGSIDRFDGDFENQEDFGRLNTRRTNAASAFLYFDPTENFTGSIKAIWQEVDDDHIAISLQGSEQNNVFPDSIGYFQGVVPSIGPEDIFLNTDEVLVPGIKRETLQFLADFTYDIAGSGFTVSYLGGYSEVDETTGSDSTFDGEQAFFLNNPLPFPPFFGRSVCQTFGVNANCETSAFNGTSSNERELFSHEIRLRSPADQAIRGSVGYFHLNEDRAGLPEFLEITEFGLDQIGDREEIRNNSFFVSLEGDVAERLTLTAELRYSRDKISTITQPYIASEFFTAAQLEGLVNPNPDAIVGDADANGDPISRSETFTAWLPRFTLVYQLTDDVNLFAQYSKGNAPGGFNSLDAPVTTIEEEKLTNYEFGFKGSFPDLGLVFNTSFFYNNYKNQGLTQSFVPDEGGALTFVQNIGTTETFGIELEANWTMNEYFSLGTTVGWLDAEITEGAVADQGILLGGLPCLTETGANGVFNPEGEGCPAGIDSIEGQTPPLVSKWQVTVSPRVNVPTGMEEIEFFAGLDAIYRSSFFAQVHNLAETGGMLRINAQAGITISDYLTIQFWGENLTQNDTPQGILRYVDFTAPSNAVTGRRNRAFGITPPQRRTYGVTVRFNF